MCSLNVRGLRKCRDSEIFVSYCSRFDIVSVSETWQTGSDDFANLLPGYSNYDSPRKRVRGQRGAGGVTVFVKNYLVEKNIVKRIYPEFEESVILYIDKSLVEITQSIIIYCTYVAPENSPVYDNPNDNGIENLNAKLAHIESDLGDVSFILAGDLNARVKDLCDYIPDDNVDIVFEEEVDYPTDPFCMPRVSRDLEVNRFGKSFIEMCCTKGIHILNGRFDDTRGDFTCTANNGSSVVDYIAISTELFPRVLNFTVGDLDISDHFPIECTLNLLKANTNEAESETVEDEAGQLHPRVVYKWKERYKQVFVERFNRLFQLFLANVTNENIGESHVQFIEVLQEAGQQMRASGKNRPNHTVVNTQPAWWDSDCAEAKCRKNRKLRLFRVSNSKPDLDAYLQSRRLFKNLCNAKRLAKQRQRRTNLLESSKKPAEFWKCIKSANSKPVCKNACEQVSSDAWFSYFEKLFSTPELPETEEDLPDLFDGAEVPNIDNETLDDPITNDEIVNSIKSLKSACAAGLDGTCMEMYKCTIDTTLPYLNSLFNSILSSRQFPQEWCLSLITPVHKKGPRDDPNNYRAISVVNSLSKIFMKILSNRLTFWTESHSVIDESQAGFRAGYSTIDNMFNLHAVVQKYLTRQNGRFYVFFIDFYKAFDTCSHQKLWNSLVRNGVKQDSKLLQVLRSMYDKLKSCVKLNGGLTEFFNCDIGTKQGCVSSTVIFLHFINDLIAHLKKNSGSGIFVTQQIEDLHAFMFADDVAAIADTVVNLQRKISAIEQFCDHTGMKLNLDKSKIVVFRNGGSLRHCERWFYKGNPIEVVSFYKYLGAYFTSRLSWFKTQQMLSMQAQKAVNTIFRYGKHFGYFSLQDAFKLFDAMVKPILVYSSPLWGFQVCSQIEKVHIQFCKRLACLNKNVANIFPLSECGRYPLSTTYMSNCIRYWTQLISMPPTRYPRQCYTMLRQIDESGRTTWATYIKRLLYQYGFGYVWIANEVGNARLLIQQFTQRLFDCEQQSILADINASPKALSYKLYKSALNPESYLSMPLPYNYKRLLANFRCSGHDLMIEKGRHSNIDRASRFCKNCEAQNIYRIEDEIHFLITCPMFADLRRQLFRDDWNTNAQANQLFATIMSDTRQDSVFALARFLNSAFELRKSLIELSQT